MSNDEEERPIMAIGEKCPLCLSVYTAPTALSCGHDLCFPCLGYMVQQLKEEKRVVCPVCLEKLYSASPYSPKPG